MLKANSIVDIHEFLFISMLILLATLLSACGGGSGGGSSGSSSPTETETFAIINDTGIDWCADGDEERDDTRLDCPVDDFPGQDGEHGRDSAARDGELEKVGAGAAGFDYTKLDVNGNSVTEETDEWSCVRDNHTGLTWEVKDDDGLRDADHTYTWYQPNGPNNGDAGEQDEDQDTGGECFTDGECDTESYVIAVNAQGLCGANDWRLPTITELSTLLHLGRSDNRIGNASRTIDDDYFPQTVTCGPSNTPDCSYWSSSPRADEDTRSFIANFWSGRVSTSLKTSDNPVRLVRADS